VRPLKLVQKCEAVTFLTAKTYLNYSWEGSEKIDKSNIGNSVVFKHLTIYEKTRSVPVGVDVESYDFVETKKKIQDLKFGAVLTINLHNKTKKKASVNILAKSLAEIRKMNCKTLKEKLEVLQLHTTGKKKCFE